MTSIRSFLLLSGLLVALAAPLQHAAAEDMPEVKTPHGDAVARVLKVVRENDVLHVELRFEATSEPFGGEIVYRDVKPEQWASAFHVDAGDQRFLLLRNAAGAPAAPAELRLNFSYDITKNPRVGAWKGEFSAPPATVKEISVSILNLPVIEHVKIVDKP